MCIASTVQWTAVENSTRTRRITVRVFCPRDFRVPDVTSADTIAVDVFQIYSRITAAKIVRRTATRIRAAFSMQEKLSSSLATGRVESSAGRSSRRFRQHLTGTHFFQITAFDCTLAQAILKCAGRRACFLGATARTGPNGIFSNVARQKRGPIDVV